MLDSTYSSLKRLINETVSPSSLIPEWLIQTLLSIVKQSVQRRAKFDIYAMDPIKDLDMCFVPALFCHASEDTVINPRHTQEMYEKYPGDVKQIIEVEGDHNSERPEDFLQTAIEFLSEHMLLEKLLTDDNLMTPEQRK